MKDDFLHTTSLLGGLPKRISPPKGPGEGQYFLPVFYFIKKSKFQNNGLWIISLQGGLG